MDWYNNTYPHEDHYQEKKAMQPYLSLNSIVNESEPITFIPLLVHVVCAEASDAVNFRVMTLHFPLSWQHALQICNMAGLSVSLTHYMSF